MFLRGLLLLKLRSQLEQLRVHAQLEDRVHAGTSSTVITSQLKPKLWHGVIADATIADSVCDRLVHTAFRIELEGESIRKAQARRKGSRTDLTEDVQADK